MQWHLNRKFPPSETRRKIALGQSIGGFRHGGALSGKSFLPVIFRTGLLLFRRGLSAVGDRPVDMLVQAFSWICSMVVVKRHRSGKAPLRLSPSRNLTSQGLSEVRNQIPSGGVREKASLAPSCLLSAHAVERHSKSLRFFSGRDVCSLQLSNGARNDKKGGWSGVTLNRAVVRDIRGVALAERRFHCEPRAGVDDAQLLRLVRMGSSGTTNPVPADCADGIMTFTINH